MAAENNQAAQSQEERNARKTRTGTVVSDKMDKTVVVKVERRYAHPLYGKQVTRTKKYHAHDENNEFHVGDVVRIEGAEGGGTRVRVTWEGVGKGAVGRLFVALMALTRGFFIRRSIQLGLDRIAAVQDAAMTNDDVRRG